MIIICKKKMYEELKKMNFTQFTDVLKTCEVKVTPARLAILKVIESAEKHLSIDEIFERAQVDVPNLGIATTYRTVKMLCDFDLLIKHNFDDCDPLYEKKQNKVHSHMVDVDTKIVEEFDSSMLEKTLRQIAKEKGFDLVTYKLELYGKKA